MGGFTPGQNDIIARLKLDPSGMRDGYVKAKQLAAAGNAELLALDAQRQRVRGELESQYTTAMRAAMAQRLSDLKSAIATEIGSMKDKSVAEQAVIMASVNATRTKYDAQLAEIRNGEKLIQQLAAMNGAYRQQLATVKEAQAAKSLFASAIGAGSGPLDRVVSGFTLGGAGTLLGISALGQSLPTLLHSIGAGFINAATGAGEYAHQIQFMSEKTGIAVKDLQQFDAIGKVTGLSLQDIVTAQRKFSVAITGQAATGADGEVMAAGGSKGPAILKALEIPNKDAITGAFRDVKSVMLDVADVFEKLPDGAEKSRIAIELFGRSGLNLIPFLNLGREGMKALQDTFEQFMPDITNLADLHRQLDIATARWTVSMMALKSHMSDELMPAIIKLVDNLASLAGIKAEGGSLIGFLLTGQTAVPGLENKLGEMTKVLSTTFKFTDVKITPEAQAKFQDLLHPVSKFALGAAFGTAAQGPLDAQSAAQQALLKRSRDALAAMQKAVAPAGTTPQPFGPEAVAAYALILDGTLKQKDAETGINKELDDRMKKVDAIFTAQGKADMARQTALDALALAEGKAGTLDDQIAQAEARLAAVIKERADLEKQGGADPEVEQAITAAIHEEVAAVDHLNQLTKERIRLHDEHVKKVSASFKKPVGTLGMDTAPEGNFLPVPVPFASKPSAFELATMAKTDAAPLLQAFLTASGVPNVMTTFMAQFFGRQQFGGGKAGQTAGKSGSFITPGPEYATAALGTAAEDKKQTDAQMAAKAISAEQAVKDYQAQKAALDDLRKANLDLLTAQQPGTAEYAKQLAVVGQIDEAIKGVSASLKEAQKNTVFSQLMNTFDQLANVAGKFSAGLGKAFSEIGASVKFATAAYKDFQTQKDAGNKVGEIGDIASAGAPAVAAAFGGQGTAGIFTSALGMASAGAMIDGPIGAGVGAVLGTTLGGIGAFKTAKQADAMRDVTEISDKVKDISSQLSEQRIGILDAITQLQGQAAAANAQMTTGKGGNQQQMTAVIGQINAQIEQLQVQAAKTIVDFKAAIGMFAVPVGVQSYAQALVQIQTALKAAAQAGASASDQVAYLNGSLAALQKTIGDTLTSEQQNVVAMMLQTLDLTAQRAQIVSDEQLAERNIQSSLGLAPTLTPGQQAAAQIAILRRNEALQLAQIDQQKALLQAQLDGQMQLFGWTQKDLDATNAKTLLLQEQVDLQKQVTAETIATLTAQMSYFATLASGAIPYLPASVNVPGFNYPSGGQFVVNGGINVTVPNPGATAQDITDAIVKALNNINILRAQGLQP